MSVTCLICNKVFSKLAPAHIKTHNMSVSTYREKFPEAIFVDINAQSYIEKANMIHESKYDYTLTKFNRTTDVVKIICPTHGEFLQQLNSHIDSKQGCPRCSHNFPYNLVDIQERSKAKYGDQYTILGPFLGNKKPLNIICHISNHGSFTISSAEVHFRKNGGCQKCALLIRMDGLKPGSISKAETKWLNSLNVPIRQHRLIINEKLIIVDGFDPTTNTVYEYHGSYWHGNPLIYTSTDINTVVGLTFGELYQRTIERENQIKTQYNLVVLWSPT